MRVIRRCNGGLLQGKAERLRSGIKSWSRLLMCRWISKEQIVPRGDTISASNSRRFASSSVPMTLNPVMFRTRMSHICDELRPNQILRHCYDGNDGSRP